MQLLTCDTLSFGIRRLRETLLRSMPRRPLLLGSFFTESLKFSSFDLENIAFARKKIVSIL